MSDKPAMLVLDNTHIHVVPPDKDECGCGSVVRGADGAAPAGVVRGLHEVLPRGLGSRIPV